MPVLQSVLQGSNIADYATGNESGPKVHSHEAPITFKPGTSVDDERFIIEEPDLGWASKFSTIPPLSTRGMGEE